jgi:hypothetical protein
MDFIEQEKFEFRKIADKDKKQYIRGIIGMKRSGKSAREKMELLPLSRRVIIFDPRDEYDNAVSLNSLHDIAKFIKENPKHFRIVVKNMEIVENVCALAYQLTNIKLVFEEVGTIIPTSTEVLSGPIWDIVFTGGHRLIDIDYISQRLSMVNIHLRSQTDEFNIFRQIEFEDAGRIRKLTGVEYEDITNLKVGHYINFNFDGISFRQVKKLTRILKTA